MTKCSIGDVILCLIFTIVILFFLVGLPLIIIFNHRSTRNPTFVVESTVVKAYNLTSDNHIFCIINLGVRAHNPNSKKKHSFYFSGVEVHVTKGKHHELADDALLGFSLDPGGGTVVDVEAVGLRLGLRRKIAEEVRADVAAGEGRVNVYMFGYVGSKYLDVACKNVVVDFSRSMVRVDQKVDCWVTVTSSKTSE